MPCVQQRAATAARASPVPWRRTGGRAKARPFTPGALGELGFLRGLPPAQRARLAAAAERRAYTVDAPVFTGGTAREALAVVARGPVTLARGVGGLRRQAPRAVRGGDDAGRDLHGHPARAGLLPQVVAPAPPEPGPGDT